MISQIVSAPAPLQTAPARGTATNGPASAFADLVQQMVSDGVGVKSLSAAAPVNNGPAPVVSVVPAGPLSGLFSEARAVTDPKKGEVKSAAVALDTVQVTAQVTAAALAVAAKSMETPVSLVSGGSARVTRKADIARPAEAAAPVIVVAVPDFVLPKPVKTPLADADTRSAPVPVAADVEEAPAALSAPAAVQVKIRAQDAESTQTLQPVATPARAVSVPVLPVELPVAVAPVTTTQPVPATAIAVIAPLEAQPQPATAKATPQPTAGASMDEPISEQPKTQPLKSVSIEFTPDGAQDVRLRLSERGGDVHISLHTTDPSLSGRMNDGVKDLVDSLTTAGYDAQAWTPDQGRQNQRQEEEPRRTRNQGSGDPDAETFDGAMQQA